LLRVFARPIKDVGRRTRPRKIPTRSVLHVDVDHDRDARNDREHVDAEVVAGHREGVDGVGREGLEQLGRNVYLVSD